MTGLFFCYMFMQLVAPSAVTIAVATDAMICTINLSVSLSGMCLMHKSLQLSNVYSMQR